MAITDANFCDKYQEDPNIQAKLDAGYEPFYVGYKLWEDAGAVANEATMCYIFGQLRAVVEAYLLAGETEPKGGVKKIHCSAFKNFFLNYACAMPTYTPEQLEALRINPKIRGSSESIAFRTAVSKYVIGDKLTPEELNLLNGALFVRVRLKAINANDGSSEERLYAIPGPIVSYWNFNPKAGVWETVDKKIVEAFEATDSKLINVSGAVQLRLGNADLPFYPPIVIGGGMTTKGSRG